MRSTAPESASSSSVENWMLWSLIVSAGAIRSLLAHHSAINGLFDDAYVSLRYAANLVRGQGFVFNSGEHVLGTTSPLHAFILAMFAKIVGISHLEAITVTLGTIVSLGLLYYSYCLLTQLGIPREVKWSYLCVLAFLPSFLENSASGMETPLVLLLMTLSIILAIEDRLAALAIVGILLFLVRIDTGIWLLALGTQILLEKQRRPLRRLALPLVAFLTGVFSWLLFSKLYFGSIIPESIVGKALNHAAFSRPDWHYVLTMLSAFVPAQRFGIWGFAVVAIGVAALLPGTVDFWKQYIPLRAMVFFVPLYVAIFLATRAPLFSWYLIPPKWAFYLVAVHSCWWWIVRGLTPLRLNFKPGIAMAAISLSIVVLGLRSGVKRLQVVGDEPWESISNLINQDTRSDGRIFLEHIGFIGYKTNRYVFDYGGLVTPRTNQLKRQYGSAWLLKGLREYRADVVVLYDTDLPAIESSDTDAIWFRDAYEQVKVYKTAELAVCVFFFKSSTRIIVN